MNSDKTTHTSLLPVSYVVSFLSSLGQSYRGISWVHCIHCDDAMMGAIAFQITSLTIVYSTVYSGADQSKHQSSASLTFVWTGEFPAQMASNAENVSIWWRHHVGVSPSHTLQDAGHGWSEHAGDPPLPAQGGNSQTRAPRHPSEGEVVSGLIQGLRPANERRRYFVTTSRRLSLAGRKPIESVPS